MRRILIALWVCALLIAPLFGSHASAHILVPSDSGDSSMIVHIKPDDDPIAGEQTEMFFDISGDVSKDQGFSLIVRTEDRLQDEISLSSYGETNYRASYVFENKGLYIISLRLGSETFTFSQRVSRGYGISNSTSKLNYAWAEMGLVGSLCLIVVILILIINRRGKILAFTHNGPRRSLNESKNKKS